MDLGLHWARVQSAIFDSHTKLLQARKYVPVIAPLAAFAGYELLSTQDADAASLSDFGSLFEKNGFSGTVLDSSENPDDFFVDLYVEGLNPSAPLGETFEGSIVLSISSPFEEPEDFYFDIYDASVLDNFTVSGSGNFVFGDSATLSAVSYDFPNDEYVDIQVEWFNAWPISDGITTDSTINGTETTINVFGKTPEFNNNNFWVYGDQWDISGGLFGTTADGFNLALEGDYNNDGTVDAADYTVWRDSEGISVQPGTGADGSGNGLVDSADYDLWVANYGETSQAFSTAASQTVPESTTLALAMAGIAAAGAAGNRPKTPAL